MLARLPVIRLSIAITLCPSARSRSVRCEPRNPAPPVTTEVGFVLAAMARLYVNPARRIGEQKRCGRGAGSAQKKEAAASGRLSHNCEGRYFPVFTFCSAVTLVFEGAAIRARRGHPAAAFALRCRAGNIPAEAIAIGRGCNQPRIVGRRSDPLRACAASDCQDS